MRSANKKARLLKVESTINVYRQNNELIEEINVDNIPFETLKEVVPQKKGDPFLYDGYVTDMFRQKKNIRRLRRS